MNKIEQIEQKFKVIKNIGGDGEALAILTNKTINNIRIVVNSFEEGQASEVWMQNFATTLTEQEQQDIFNIYQIFKNSLSSLDAVMDK